MIVAVLSTFYVLMSLALSQFIINSSSLSSKCELCGPFMLLIIQRSTNYKNGRAFSDKLTILVKCNQSSP